MGRCRARLFGYFFIMNILTVGTDINIFNQESAVARRVLEYGTLVDELHIIVLSGRGFSTTKLGDNVFVYPTNSLFFPLRVIDAYRIGKKICSQRHFDVISTQDPAESGLVGAWLKKKFQISLQI